MGEGRSACCVCCPKPPLDAYSMVSCSVSSAIFVVDEAVDCVVSLCTPNRLLKSQPLQNQIEKKLIFRISYNKYSHSSNCTVASLYQTHRLCSVLLLLFCAVADVKIPVKYGFFRTAFGEPIGDAGKDLEPLRIIFLSDLMIASSPTEIFPACPSMDLPRAAFNAPLESGRSSSLSASSKLATVKPREKGRFKLTI